MINKTHISFLALVLVFLALLISCKAKKPEQAPLPEEQCAFYTFKLMRDSVLNKTSAELTNVNVVNNKVRYIIDEAKKQEPYFLKFEVIYSGNKTIYAFTEHPLYKRVDLYSESGEIEAKLISLAQGEVFLRIPYFGKYKKIIITEIVNYKESPVTVLKNEK